MCSIQQVENWLQQALSCQNIHILSLNITGNTSLGDNYLSHVTFVQVTVKNEENKQEILNLAVKSSKKAIASKLSIHLVFDKEMYIYNKVKPTFDQFLEENSMESLRFLPKCYGSITQEENQVLVLKNLRSKAYEMWNRKTAMEMGHIQLVFTEMGKWHGLSLALKQQKPEVFLKLTRNNVNVMSEFMKDEKVIKSTVNQLLKIRRELEHCGKLGVSQKIGKIQEEIKFILTDLFKEENDYHVILHGDCWNNNYMFKYEDNQTVPVKVKILDWQCSGLGSPVLDLSNFLYCCGSEKIFQNLYKLLKIYHNSLSHTIEQLGCDPNDVFPFPILLDHWKKFSKYGLVISAFILNFALCDIEDIPDFVTAESHDKSFLEDMQFNKKNKKLYFDRMKDVFIHFAENDFF